MNRIAWGVTALLLGGLAIWWWFPRGARPALGPVGNQLQDCPDSPNCVACGASDPGHALPPLTCQGSQDEVQAALQDLLDPRPGWRRIESRPGYLRYEVTSRWWRFVDDVEFLVDAGAGQVRMRSASRIGHSDLGANRRRLESVRSDWELRAPRTTPRADNR